MQKVYEREQFLHQYRQSNKEEKMTDNYNGEIESMVEHSTFAISDHQHGGEEDRTQSISLFRSSTRRRRGQNTVDLPVQIINKAENR